MIKSIELHDSYITNIIELIYDQPEVDRMSRKVMLRLAKIANGSG